MVITMRYADDENDRDQPDMGDMTSDPAHRHGGTGNQPHANVPHDSPTGDDSADTARPPAPTGMLRLDGCTLLGIDRDTGMPTVVSGPVFLMREVAAQIPPDAIAHLANRKA